MGDTGAHAELKTSWWRWMLRGLAAAAFIGAVAVAVPMLLDPKLPDLDEQVLPWQRELRVQALARVRAGQLGRGGGEATVKAVDVAQLAAYAAMAGDDELYEPLRRFMLDKLLVRKQYGGKERVFVAWAYTPGQTAPDATGTTEALRVAEALWLGSQAFGDRHFDDRRLALDILEGYALHATTDRGVWFIANYYNLGLDHFVTNSYTVDYDPDFVRHAADATGDPALAELADKSLALVQDAAADNGLIKSIIQPEIITLVPGGTGVFSPDGVEQLNNVLTVAERVARTDPALARRTLRFMLDQREPVHLYYRVDTGEPYGDGLAGIETYAAATRLAVRLGDRRAADRFMDRLLDFSKWHRENPDVEPALYRVGESLLAIELYRRMVEDEPLPLAGDPPSTTQPDSDNI